MPKSKPTAILRNGPLNGGLHSEFACEFSLGVAVAHNGHVYRYERSDVFEGNLRVFFYDCDLSRLRNRKGKKS